jgi:hypothetical protein
MPSVLTGYMVTYRLYGYLPIIWYFQIGISILAATDSQILFYYLIMWISTANIMGSH